MKCKTMLTVSEAAREKGCTIKYLYDLLRAGRLRGAVKSGKTWLIPVAAIQRGNDQAA